MTTRQTQLFENLVERYSKLVDEGNDLFLEERPFLTKRGAGFNYQPERMAEIDRKKIAVLKEIKLLCPDKKL